MKHGEISHKNVVTPNKSKAIMSQGNDGYEKQNIIVNEIFQNKISGKVE